MGGRKKQNVQKRPAKLGNLSKITGPEQGRSRKSRPPAWPSSLPAVVIASEPSFQVGSLPSVANATQKARRGVRPGFSQDFFRLRFLARVTFQVKRNFRI